MQNQIRLAVPNFISNSYFPAIAAVELGFFAEFGIRAAIKPISPINRAYEALRSGEVEIVAGSAHSAVSAFPNWEGVRLLCAQSQGMYWLLVMDPGLKIQRGDVASMRGKRIGAAPWAEMGLRGLLAAAKIDSVEIVSISDETQRNTNFGLRATRALERGLIDGFWGSGLEAEIAVQSGAGSVVLDVRRGDGPASCFTHTMASIAATTRWIQEKPELAMIAVRAIVKAQNILRVNVNLAFEVAQELFPTSAARWIVDVVQRDIPYYNPEISAEYIEGMIQFSQDLNIVDRPLHYGDIVATNMLPYWW